MRLHDFRALSFDCFGTLVDWESGIGAALRPLLDASPSTTPAAALEAFARHESAEERANPRRRYSEVLACVYRGLAEEWRLEVASGDADRFAASLASWPVFPDTVAALQYLKQHFWLVILSNVDRRGFAATAPHLGVAFDAVFTAEDIGSYKPDLANFRYLVERLADLGIARSEILHTAQSLYHDHVPAQRMGLASSWIDRRHATSGFGATPAPPEEAHPDFRFPSLAAMVEAHRSEIPGSETPGPGTPG